MTTLAPLLPLFLAVPLLAAATCVLARRVAVTRALLLGVPAATAAGGLGLLVAVLRGPAPVLADSVGGYVPGIAIGFAADALSAAMLLVTGLTTTVCAWFLAATGQDRPRFVPALALLLTAGVNGALLTADVFNLFVCVEVMLLPSYALLAVSGTWRRLGAARTFILVNLVTSTILLMGVGLVYGVAGTANLGSLEGRAAQDPRLGAAVAVVLLAFCVKAGFVPVHGWLPQTYPSTSAGTMALFSGLHTKVGLYALFRVTSVLYGGHEPAWLWVLAVVAIVTMVVGSFASAGERRMRTALAYQMVGGVGHIAVGLVAGLAAGAAVGFAAGLFYLVHHIVTMGGLLLLAGAIEHTYGTGRYDRLAGLARRDRALTVAFVLGLFSLVGFPPTSGLWGKIGLVVAAAEAGGWAIPLVAAIVLASLGTVVAMQRLWVDVFWGPPMETYRPDDLRTGRGEPVPLPDDVRVRPAWAAPGIVLVGLSVLLFVAAGVAWPVADAAAAGLLDPRAYAEAVLR